MRVFALGLVLLVGCSWEPARDGEALGGAGGARAGGDSGASTAGAAEHGEAGEAGAVEAPRGGAGSGPSAGASGLDDAGEAGDGGAPDVGAGGSAVAGAGGVAKGGAGGSGPHHAGASGAGGHSAGSAGFVEPASCSQVSQGEAYTCNDLYGGNKICLDGSCVACGLGRLDCNHDPADGCEADAGDPAHCGGCSKACKTDLGAKCVATATSFVCKVGT